MYSLWLCNHHHGSPLWFCNEWLYATITIVIQLHSMQGKSSHNHYGYVFTMVMYPPWLSIHHGHVTNMFCQ